MSTAFDDSAKLAQTYLTVANTPLYIVRMLRSSDEVRAAAAEKSQIQVEKMLKRAISAEPKNLRQEALPYLYVVILGMQGATDALDRIAKLDARHHRWFARILDFVRKTTSSSVFNEIKLDQAGATSATIFADGHSANNTIEKIDLGGAL